MSDHLLPDETNLAILNALQDDLPLVSRPWKAIADRLGIRETGMISRLKTLEEAGIIRGISPVLESRHLGLHAATLVALHVPEERVDEIAAIDGVHVLFVARRLSPGGAADLLAAACWVERVERIGQMRGAVAR